VNCHVSRSYHVNDVCLYLSHQGAPTGLCAVCGKLKLLPWKHNVAFRVYQKANQERCYIEVTPRSWLHGGHQAINISYPEPIK
jgi:hypothetical protein